MDIRQLREGNIIVVYPRANQQGILAIREVQRESMICDMLSPRKGYQFRIRFSEINPVRLSDEWLVKASFRLDPKESGKWLCPHDQLAFRFSGHAGVFGQAEDHQVEYLHQLQNTYLELTGKKLHITLN
ncbi:hypothetical protein [Arcticibacter sp.]|jgi:hypothetical protein|uniref:hypothetical protein n=1 Tax=Arcticibacter sp. TaxID=1872630 RepID=UPI00388CF3B8